MLGQLLLKRALRGSCSAGPPDAGDMCQMMVSQAEPGLASPIGAAWHAAVDVKKESSLHEGIICYIEATALQGYIERLLCDTANTSLPQLHWMHRGWSVLLNLITTLFRKGPLS